MHIDLDPSEQAKRINNYQSLHKERNHSNGVFCRRNFRHGLLVAEVSEGQVVMRCKGGCNYEQPEYPACALVFSDEELAIAKDKTQ